MKMQKPTPCLDRTRHSQRRYVHRHAVIILNIDVVCVFVSAHTDVSQRTKRSTDGQLRSQSKP